MSRMTPLAAVAVAATLLPAATAVAAPPWSAPVPVDAGVQPDHRPTLVHNTAGEGLLTFSTTPEGDARSTFTTLVARDQSGGFGARRKIAGRVVDVVRSDEERELLALRVLPGDGERVGVSVASAGLAVSQVHVLGSGRFIRTPVIAANERGDAAVAWVEDRPGKDRIRVSLRKTGGPFGAARTIAQADGFTNADVAVGAEGQVAVAYGERTGSKRAVRALVGKVAQPSALRSHTIGTHGGYADPAAAYASNGRLVVVYGEQDAGTVAKKPYVVRTVSLRSGATAFSAPRELEPAGAVQRSPGRVRVIPVGSEGRVLATWTAAKAGGGFPLRVAVADDRGRFGAARDLAANGADADLAVRPDGRVTAAWTAFTGDQAVNRRIHSATFALAGTDAITAEEVTASGQLGAGPALSLDPRNGRPAVAFNGGTTGQIQVLASQRSE